MSIKLNGATNGSIQLDVPAAIGSDLNVTLPATAGEVAVIDSNGNLGIGTTSPQAALDISKTPVAGEPGLLIGTHPATSTSDIALTANAVIRSENSIQNVVNTGGIFTWLIGGTDNKAGIADATEKMRIDTSGRLLVGTNSTLGPAGFSPLLQVQDTNNSHISLTRNIDSAAKSHLIFSKTRGSAASPSIVQNNDALGGIIFCGHDGNGLGSIGASIEVNVDGTPGASDMPGRLVFSTTADGASSVTERMRINSSGNVGIGASSPSSKLEVTGFIQSSQGLKFNATDSAYGLFPLGSQTLAFNINSDEKVRINSAGNVGIGTASPSGLLHLEGTGNTDLYVTSSTTNNSRIWFGDSSNRVEASIQYSNTNNNISISKTGGTGIVVDSNNNVGIGTASPSYQLQLSTDSAGKPSTNTWTIVSDERIKEEIELADLDLCYEAVKNIPLKRFKWKDEIYTEEQAYDRRKLGWIAQDVEAVFPKAVRQHEFKYNQVFEEVVIPAVAEELDDDGNIVTEVQPERIEKGELISEDIIEDCRDLNSDQIYAAMYGAIQKLISKVESLEVKVAALEANP